MFKTNVPLACLIVMMAVSAGCGDSSGVPPGVDAGTDAADLDGAEVVLELIALDPEQGPVASAVVLTGTRFGDVQGTGFVTIGGEPAVVTAWSDTSITVAVPNLGLGDADVTVTTPDGTTGAQVFTVVMPPALYINNNPLDPATNTLTAMSFDPTTGALAEMAGSPYTLGDTSFNFGGCAQSVKVHEGSSRLFATSNATVAVFDINNATGVPTAVAGSPFSTGAAGALSVTVNNAGTRIFVANWVFDAGSVSVLDVAGDGSLTPVAGSPFAVDGIKPDIAALSLVEEYLFVNNEDGAIEVFAVADNGALSAIANSPFVDGSGAFSLAHRPGLPQLLLPDNLDLYVYSYNPATGEPTQIASSPFTVSAPGWAHSVSFTSDGNRTYIGTYNTGWFHVFDLAADGTPTEIAGSPFDVKAQTANLGCVYVSKDDAYLVGVDEGGGDVGVFSIGADGAPTPVLNSPFANSADEVASGLAATF